MRLTICSFLLALVSTAVGGTLLVPSQYGTIQAAIDAAVSDVDQIEVAPGTYSEAINFNKKAVRLYSSGGPAVTTIDATELGSSVVTCNSSEGATTIMEGFTITGGNGVRGGGMYNYFSSPTVTNCIFSSNMCIGGGGGMSNEASSPTVINCTFSGNQATAGGGMANYIWDATDSCNPTVTNCTFSGNTAVAGGGMFNGGANPTVTNCIFSGNSAPYGGGMWNFDASPTVTNCTFSSNTSDTRGSGMHNEYYSHPTVTNCTFTSNTGGGGMMNFNYASPTVTNCTFTSNTGSGGMWNFQDASPTVTNCTFSNNTGLYSSGMYNDYRSNPTVTNSILWGSGPVWSQDQIVNGFESTATVTYSDVQGSYEGTGNIDADPIFRDALNGDYRLLSGSPCIDVGNNAAVPADVTTDLDGNPRIQGLCVDMGAFEATPATPETMLAGLRAYIVEQVGLGIDAEMEVSLLAKVDAAISALNRGNANDVKVVMNDLKALVNQVEAQTDKKIMPDVAAKIIDRANAIITALGG
jgi:hypothetical protein